MAKMGRKTLREEIDLTHRYAALSEKAFRLISKRLDSTSKKDQEYALDWLKAGFSRMVMQQTDVTSGGKPIVYMPNEIIEKYNLNGLSPSTEANSQGQPPVSGN